MATPTKDALQDKLRGLGFTPPEDASSAELQTLLKKVKALPAALTVPERPEPAPTPAPTAPSASAPPLRPPAPLVRAGQHPGHVPPARLSSVAAVPAVPAPPRSDHELRPHDPLAGW